MWREASTSAAAFRHGNHAVSPEMHLLVLCARSEISDSRRDSIQELQKSELDWKAVWDLGRWHGVLPFLDYHARGHLLRAMPDKLLDALRHRQEANAHWHLQATAELLRIVNGLTEQGIAAIPMKGPVFAYTLYPQTTLREFSDLDILVDEGDVEGARELLLSLGFLPNANLTKGQLRAFQWAMHAQALQRASDKLSVDLHWRLAPTYLASAVPLAELTRRTTPCRIGGARLRIFSPEATLLLICLHGAKHGPVPWPKLKWLCDLSELLRAAPNLEWKQVTGVADKYGCARVLDLGLGLAWNLLGAKLPGEIAERVEADRAAASIAALARRRLFSEQAGSISTVTQVKIMLTLRERRRDKLLSAIRQTFVPRRQDWDLVHLPRGAAFLYTPIRLLRIGIGRLVGLSRGKKRRGNGIREAGAHTADI